MRDRRRAGHRRRRCAPVTAVDEQAPAPRRQLADLPGVLRPADRHGHGVGPGHQRRVRLHVDADQPAPRPPARRRRRRLRPARADVPPRGGRRLQGQPRPRRPTSCASRWASSARSSRRSASRSSSWPGFEADDIIATLADRGQGPRRRGDHRHRRPRRYQLVEDPHVKVLYNRRGVSDYALYDEAGIQERTGVTPGAVRRSTPRSAATRPTTCPACPGVGEKTAAKLINTYGGLDGIFAHLDEQTPKLRAEPGRARGAGAAATPR